MNAVLSENVKLSKLIRLALFEYYKRIINSFSTEHTIIYYAVACKIIIAIPYKTIITRFNKSETVKNSSNI